MSLRKGSSELTAEASDPPIGVRDLLRPSGPPPYRMEVRSRHVSQRRALSPRHAGQPLSGLTVPAYYQGAQCSRLCRTRAEPVCCINWKRRHDAFPSCRLRRKLRSPFSYVAGDAASYAWRRFDKTAPGHDERGTPGAGKGIQERDLLCLRRHNV